MAEIFHHRRRSPSPKDGSWDSPILTFTYVGAQPRKPQLPGFWRWDSWLAAVIEISSRTTTLHYCET